MVEFLYPYSFLLLVFLVMFFRKNSEFNVNPKLILNKSNLKFKKYLLVLSYIFLVVAFARPVSDKKEINTHNNIKKVVLALDISKSMLAKDVYPNRLGFAKHKMEQFIDKFNGEISIIAFSNTAFLISPYTSDKDTLKYLLNNIDTSYITASGTNFENLITTAKKMDYKDIIVFSDGGDDKKLDTKGINLYSLIIGNKPAPIPLKNGELLSNNGKVVLVGINKYISNFSKFAVIAGTNNNDINKLILQNFSKIKNSKKVVIYNELFIYPLSLGVFLLFLSMFSLPKRFLPLILLATIQAKAGMLDWYYLDKAQQYYNQGNYQNSYKFYSKIDNEEAKFNQANSLYKMKKYKEALKIYQSIKDEKLKEKLFYNQGNCYAKLSKIDEAIKKYKEALRINPQDKEAKYNLELLEKKKNNEKKKNSSKNKQKQKDNKQKQKEHKKAQQKKKDKVNSNKKDNKSEHKEKEKKKEKKSIQIKPNSTSEVFNKIKSQTLMLPLSKGDKKNEW